MFLSFLLLCFLLLLLLVALKLDVFFSSILFLQSIENSHKRENLEKVSFDNHDNSEGNKKKFGI